MVIASQLKERKLSGTFLLVVALIIVLLSRFAIFGAYWQWKTATGSDFGIFRALMQWDCGWYSSIAEVGYATEEMVDVSGQANWAFFPLVPMLERFLSSVTGLPIRVAGVCMNTAFLYLLTVISGKFCIEYDSGSWEQALILMLLINFGPYNIYYSTLYTECLFALLLCTTLYCLYKKYWFLMGVFGALLSSTRNTGIFIVFVIPAYCAKCYFSAQEGKCKSVFGFFRWIYERPKLILGTCLMPMGFFLYMLFLDTLIGDGMAFMTVQYAWGRSVGNALLNLWNGLLVIGTDSYFHAVCTVIALYLAIRQILRKRPVGVLSLIFVLVPLSTSVYGMARYTLCSFPILLEASHAIFQKKRFEQCAWGMFLAALGVATSYWWFRGSIMLM